MVFVMYGVVLAAVFVAVALSAIRDARIAGQFFPRTEPGGSWLILITPQQVRLDKERVESHV